LQIFYLHSDRILALKPTEYGHLLGVEMPSQAVTFGYFGQGLRRVSRFRASGPSLSWAVAPAYLKVVSGTTNRMSFPHILQLR
jgi:hypothetical protein